ncbi:MAG: cohesin domain-containing protein [Clostridia bacterium]|nr:cohesin domain-containing protein [Clostridia bacterium]
MKKTRKIIALFLTALLLVGNLVAGVATVSAAGGSYITMEFDKNKAAVGEIIKVSLKVNDIANLAAAFQVNIKYDPAVLEAVNATTGAAYSNSSRPAQGDIFQDADVATAANDIEKGILNFAKSFTAARTPEPTGTLAVFGFKVKKAVATNVTFADTATMPKAVTGTLLFSKPGESNIQGYEVKQPGAINPDGVTTPPVTTAPPTTPPVGDSFITIDFDKTVAEVNDIITASVKVNAVTGLAAAFQVNIKYDQTVLQAVALSNGAPYSNSTRPSQGDIFVDADVSTAANDVEKGILNFAKSFTAARTAEPTGTLAKIGFKVLKKQATNITFADSATMPKSISGTLLFSQPGQSNLQNYSVKQPVTINGDVTTTPPVTTPPTTPPVTTPPTTPPVTTPPATDSYITIEFDKAKVSVGEIVTASVKVNNIAKLAQAYQVNIKFNKDLLQAIDLKTGSPYANNTRPLPGNIFNDTDVSTAANDLEKGIINFAASYITPAGAQPTGILGKIGFKALKDGSAAVAFENSTTMPNANTGTLMFEKAGTAAITGYTVNQPAPIEIVTVIPTTPPPSGLKVVIDPAKAPAGSTVEIPVKLTDIPAGGLTAAALTLAIDSNIVESITVTPGSEIVAKGYDATFESSQEVVGTKSLVTLLYNDATGGNAPLTTSATFATLKVKIKAGTAKGTYAITEYVGGTYKTAFADKDSKQIGATLSLGGIQVVDGLLGDVDENGQVNVVDLQVLTRYLLKIPGVKINMYNSDLNQDGFVDVVDAQILTRYLLGKIKTLPYLD